MSCCLQQKLINHNGDCVHKKLHVSLFQISSLFLIPKQKTRCGLANGIEDFQLRGHPCVNNVQHCLCYLYTRMRHSRQTATSLLTKRHANFDTSTRSAKGHNCSPWHTACSGSPHNALHSSSNLAIQYSCCIDRLSFLLCATSLNCHVIRPLQKVLS